ncbi:M24 family metallopeptidase [Mediterraneibacter sp. NSJ-55]|uniref:M24 family metallopeptidase n=1 Tax=Mediterraneibacter hominis TaxID=2763054 RepID=A0A923LJN4_9FIRM|nr:M24 family metallopeptidase [Mediterraneibacter hominis]MBC5689479.1 M24 family metallopeptidase [Mediterraneibacter hominis]
MIREVNEKINRVRGFMKEENLDAILLTTTPNFFWITGGKRGYVDRGTQDAAVKILIEKEKAYVICNSSEKYRVMDEELTDGSFELIGYLWHEDEAEILKPYLDGKKLGSDSGIYGSENVGGKIQKLRYVLTEEEEIRMREIGPECAQILEDCVREIKPGETELEAAGRVMGRLTARGYQIPVCLVASDERMYKYRHPLPTEKKIEKYAMIAICGQKYGLTVSISRIVSFGPVPDEIQRKYEALLKIDATYILNTKAGVWSQDVLNKAYEAYKEQGYEADFHLHHQGGALGYLTRDYCTNERTQERIYDHQGYSWNPTIAGVKLEDTYLINGEQQEIISDTGNWVYREVTIDGKTIRRPDIWIQEKK